LTQFTEGVPSSPVGAQTAEQADAADLQSAIGELAGLAAGSLGLPELLAEVATFAVHAIPGAEGAGVTLLRLDRTENIVQALAASAPFVAEIDDVQYVTLQEGPCITAALERRTVRSGSLGGEKMWPRFGPRVEEVLTAGLRQVVAGGPVLVCFTAGHGEPVHWADPSRIGISDIAHPDEGDAVPIASDEVPVFWGCGVTAQTVIRDSGVPFAITHEPGFMFVTDLKSR